MTFANQMKQALLLTIVLMALCGVAYPFALTGISQVLAPEKANGSLLSLDGKVVGSALIGQDFTDPRFLKCRPSAVRYNTYTAEQKADGSYTGVASGSANMGNSNPALAERVAADMKIFLAAHPGLTAKDLPAELFTASGSGLDPHISPAAASIQLPVLAENTGLSIEALKAIIDSHTTEKLGGILGEPTVHVLKVNMDIARALKDSSTAPVLPRTE